jgi:hypothetical protein
VIDKWGRTDYDKSSAAGPQGSLLSGGIAVELGDPPKARHTLAFTITVVGGMSDQTGDRRLTFPLPAKKSHPCSQSGFGCTARMTRESCHELLSDPIILYCRRLATAD